MGIAKLYYLKEYSGLHQRDSSYHGKNISIGIGVSDLENGYDAAVSAAKQAAMQSSQGGSPTFSIVFVSSKYNKQIEKVVRGINTILGANWAGCTTDKEFNSIIGYSNGTIEVLCIESPYMHFGVGVSKKYRKDPQKLGNSATLKAIENCPVERSVFATTQFMRGTKKGLIDIVRSPPYFILTLIGGTRYIKGVPDPGRETEFLNGILDVVGSQIPVIGASASSDFESLAQGIAENYQFAEGKCYSDAGLVIFAVSDLYTSFSLEHGYDISPKMALISKLGAEGRLIKELNNKPAVAEYCRLLNIKTASFLKEPWKYTSRRPLGTVDFDGNIYLRTIALNPDKKTFSTIPKLIEGSFVNISKYNPKSFSSAMASCISQGKKERAGKKPAFALMFSCSGRRAIHNSDIVQSHEILRKSHSDLSIFGYYSFGEVGARSGRYPQFNNQTCVALVLFDSLLTE
jgi:hypothetical protein